MHPYSEEQELFMLNNVVKECSGLSQPIYPTMTVLFHIKITQTSYKTFIKIRNMTSISSPGVLVQFELH